MPVCHRCERVQATAELRRTTLGYLCKENTRGTTCWTTARELAAARRRDNVAQLQLHLPRRAEPSAA